MIHTASERARIRGADPLTGRYSGAVSRTASPRPAAGDRYALCGTVERVVDAGVADDLLVADAAGHPGAVRAVRNRNTGPLSRILAERS